MPLNTNSFIIILMGLTIIAVWLIRHANQLAIHAPNLAP